MQKTPSARLFPDGRRIAPIHEDAMEYSSAWTLTELLEEKARLTPNETAYTFIYHRDGKENIYEFTFKEVYDEARRIAADLKRMGLKRGQRVLVFSSQTHDNILSLFGTLYAGGIIVIIPPPVDAQKKLRFKSVLKSAKPRFILCNKFLAPILEKAMYPKAVPTFLMKGLIRLAKGFSLFNIDNGRCKPDDYVPEAIDPNDTAVLQYTSGSVSQPKGIMLSHRNILSNIRDIAKTAAYPMREPSVGFAPFFHSIGLVYHGLFSVYVGYNSINMTPPAFMEDPFRLFDIASRYGAFLIAAPNSIYRLCADVLDKEKVKDLDLSAIKAAGNGSEAIDIETLEAFAELMDGTGFSIDSFTPGYGMSETTILVSCQKKPAPIRTAVVEASRVAENFFEEAAADSRDKRTFVSCGEVMDSFTVRIVNPETEKLCGPGEIGEIWVQGPAVAKGYWNNEAETQKTFRNTLSGEDGFFLRTGDLGILHEGHLYVTGRIKELIIVAGKNYYPQDFELAAAGIPGMKDCDFAAFSVTNNRKEEFVLCVEAAAGINRQNASEAIAAVLLEKFGLSPHDIVFVTSASLPRTDNRKIRRIAVKDLYLKDKLERIPSSAPNNGKPADKAAEGAAGPSKAGPASGSSAAASALHKAPTDEIEARILRELTEKFNLKKNPGPEDNLLAAGMDSLAVTRLVFALEAMFGVKIPFSEFIGRPTARRLAVRIGALLDGEAANSAGGGIDLKKEAVLPDDLRFASPGRPNITKPSAIFLTGATGFLGAYLIRELIRETDSVLFCHVRAADAESGMQRIRNNLLSYRSWDESMRNRIIPILGDLSRPSLGMSAKDFSRIAEEADIVLHNGAHLNFLYPYQMMKETNVGSVIEAIRLCAAGKPKRLAYISSYSIFDSPSYFEKIVDETSEASVSEGFLLGYSQTKWVAEKCIASAREKGLDALVFRPGQITGDTENGIWKAADFASQFLISSIQLGMVPDLDVFVPMTPVDYIGKAVVALMLQESGNVTNYHLLNTEEQTVADLTEFFSKAGIDVKRVPFDAWRSAFEKQGEDNILYYFKDLIGGKDTAGLSFFDRYSKRQAKVLAPHTEANLRPLGIECPGIDEKLMMKYIASFREQDVI